MYNIQCKYDMVITHCNRFAFVNSRYITGSMVIIRTLSVVYNNIEEPLINELINVRIAGTMCTSNYKTIIDFPVDTYLPI